jgi:hypothetical protein
MAPTVRPPVPATLLLVSGVVLVVAPASVLEAAVEAAWRAEMVRWWGLSLVLFWWAARSSRRRGIAVDAPSSGMMTAGSLAGLGGVVGAHPLLLVLAFSLTAAALCRTALVIGFDVHQTARRRLQG